MLLTTFGEFWFKKKKKKTRKYSHNFQRNHRNKESSIPLHRGASVFHTNRSNLHPLFVGAFQDFEKRLLASPCLSVPPPIRKNSAPGEWTFMKFDMSVFRKSVEKIQVN